MEYFNYPFLNAQLLKCNLKPVAIISPKHTGNKEKMKANYYEYKKSNNTELIEREGHDLNEWHISNLMGLVAIIFIRHGERWSSTEVLVQIRKDEQNG